MRKGMIDNVHIMIIHFYITVIKRALCRSLHFCLTLKSKTAVHTRMFTAQWTTSN